MSRIVKVYGPVTIVRGHDEVMGEFVQVQDARFASTAGDYQGEGYVLDYDELFGFRLISLNRIGATQKDLGSDERLVALTNEWWQNENESTESEEEALLEMTDSNVDEEPVEGDYFNDELEYPQ